MIRFRRPKQDDPIIISLIKKELVPLSSLPTNELNKVIEELPKRLSRGVTLVVSPYYESDLVGFIHFMIHGELLYIDMMAVLPAHRSKQHGKTLMAQAENFASSRGCKRSKVMVDQDNTRAHQFYQKLGYRSVRFIQISQCFELEKNLSILA
ncbi:ribosomal protein S18 acetylase RimI-like enzyme [Paenibacillus anaericanus]|uniref:GNAT family N-acetyltransferase n=1 Tax=Paenibacillus anaericanus TaxID=170367 RepID=A0A433Y8Y2_9BACL|nr:GNAT family N-acetyltransferase [Paenibacillus anaericanus]MDQ0087203.1 ribosomal protein S18 acetylase RimI-like enzyme [Paenibacillus anaericanus]RUT46351.1 GNAT family N-acetyltransferase [Paenibacillus anaericanus]